MEIEVKNVKFVEAFSEETFCFTASIWVDGKKVGEASNRGHGGQTDLIYNDGYPHKSATHKAIKEYCETLPPMQSDMEVITLEDGEEIDRSWTMEYDPYILIDELIGEEYERQQNKKLCRGKTAFRMPNHEYESKYEYHILNHKYTPAVKAELIKRYGEEVYILNEHI
tara:strand:- start:1113 stop:1616 length:504 start_codon:yes stop_codon:yes gene_type:complete